MTRPVLALTLATAFGACWALLRRVAYGRPRGGAADVPRSAALWGGLSGLLLGAGCLFTFSAVLLVPVFTGAAVLALVRRDGTGRGELARLTAAGAACLAVLLAAYAAGFDIWACVRQAAELDGREAPAFLSPSYWAMTRLMGVMDFAVMSGAALSALWLRSMVRSHDPDFVPWGRLVASACLVVLACGVDKIGETGRIWLFLVPFLVLPAARATARGSGRSGVDAVILIHAVQVFLFEYFLDTRW